MTPMHASCVAIGGHAVLITGPSGSGKSDLALRLIDRGAELVSDDYTQVEARERHVWASPPETIQGLIEVRGLGILAIPWRASAPIALLVSLVERVDRMPDPLFQPISVAGIDIASLGLLAHEPSAPIKVEMALNRLLQR